MINISVIENPITITTTDDNDNVVVLTVNGDETVSITETGATGPQGIKGDPGSGVPAGGAIGYRLTKRSTTDFDTEWQPPTAIPVGSDKTIQFNDGGVIAGNDNLRFDKNTNALMIGIEGAIPDNPLSIRKALDSYLQVNIQNTTEGASASSDYICTADNGTDEGHYIDMGINSSIYDVEEYSATGPNDGYVIVDDGNFVFGAGTTGNNVQVIAGGTTADDIVATIDTTGIDIIAGASFSVDGVKLPIVLYGTGSAPSASGLTDGTLYFKYEA